MKRKLQKYLVIAAGMSLAATSINAIPRGPCDLPPEDVCCEDPKPGPFAFKYPKDIGLVCPRGFYVAGDLLVMQAKQNGLDYSMVNTSGEDNANSIASTSLTGGNVEGYSSNDTDWDWGLGFRINIGFLSNHDSWNLDAEYTYFHYTEDASTSVKGSGRTLPFWLVPTAFPTTNNVPAREASAQWIMNYNTLDLSLGKPHHLSRYLITNPFFGLRLAWIDQNYLARYGGTYRDSADGFSTQLGAEMNAKNDLWSVGLRAGIQTTWILGAGFEIIGNTAASILYTKFDLDQAVALALNSYKVAHDFYHNIPNFEVMMGLGYSTLFNKNRHRVYCRVLYEFHQWWNVNQMRRFFDNTFWSANDKVSRGDLTLNGLSFRIGFDF